MAADWGRLSRRLSRRFAVEQLDPGRLEELVPFFQRAYADQPLARAFQDPDQILRRLRWLNEELLGPGQLRPMVWLCRKEGRIVGHFAALPALATAQKKEVPVWWGRDLMVAPEARQEGVGPFLIMAAVRSAGENLLLIAGLNERSFALFRRMGFLDMGKIPLYLRVYQPDRLADTLPWPWAARRAASWLARRRAPFTFRRSRGDGAFSFQTLERFDERFDRWWRDVEAAFPCVVRRDSGTMNWRYLRHPDHRYMAFSAIRGGAFRGVGVVRHGRSRGLPAGFVTELLAHPRDREALRGLLAHAENLLLSSAPEPPAFIRCVSLHPAVEGALCRSGYLRVSSPIHWMMAHARGPTALRGFTRRRDWFLNGGDSDLDVV